MRIDVFDYDDGLELDDDDLEDYRPGASEHDDDDFEDYRPGAYRCDIKVLVYEKVGEKIRPVELRGSLEVVVA